MRYEGLKDILDLAVRLQGAYGGLTLDDIQAEFSISRRTAERRRDAVDAAFGPLEPIDKGDGKRHWRLRSDALRRLVPVSAEDLAALEATATALDGRAGLGERAAALLQLATKLRAMLRTESQARMASKLEMLVQAEGLAMRPGPRERLDQGLLALLREAITACRVVEFRYFAQLTRRHSCQRIRPYGLLYGNRTHLVGRTERAEEPRLWRLANMSETRITDEAFVRDPAFDLQRYAERSFGTYQEKPINVVLRFNAKAARDAAAFHFHPNQNVEENEDGSLTVRFEAGGIDEMCWHLVTWGKSVVVETPACLRRRLAAMCASLAAHHSPCER